jgi:two-component system, cell cycle sensor histidine kinase and response regulator CckA
MKRIQELDRFFALSPDLLCILDFDGNFVTLNPAWEYTLGYSVEELQSLPYFDRIHPDDRNQTFETASVLMRETSSGTFLNRYQCKDGSHKWLRWNCTSDLFRREIYAIARDVTPVRKLQDELHELNTTLEQRVRVRTEQWQRSNEALRAEVGVRMNTEESLRQAYQTLTSILNASPHAIIAVDSQRNVKVWNTAATRIFGWSEEEVVGNKVPFVTESTREQSQVFNERALKGETFINYEVRRHRRDGTPLELLVSAAPTYDSSGVIDGFLTVATDITEHKKLEEQLLRTQRLESLGTLASGIAHDLNNVLSPIVMSLELFRMKTTDPSRLRILDTLDQCAKRGTDLIQQVLTFARGAHGERVPVQTKQVLGDIEKVIRQTMPKVISVSVDLPDDLWEISADVTHFHQVLMNLTVNARDAMPDGGNLTITARNVTLDQPYVVMNPVAAAGAFVMVEVQDSGNGISPEIRQKIFEPFFTTKEIGKGTGLGLSTVAAIVKNHGGFMNLYSEPGRGTSFKVYFPALEGQTAQASKPLSSMIPMGTGQTVLVVDDDSAVRDIAKLTLEAHGYKVLVAQDGAEGVAQYAKHKVQLVISDMDMPVMNGAAMIRSLERIDPDVRIISASGLATADFTQQPVSPSRAVLPKPYTAEQLLRTVHKLLHAA